MKKWVRKLLVFFTATYKDGLGNSVKPKGRSEMIFTDIKKNKYIVSSEMLFDDVYDFTISSKMIKPIHSDNNTILLDNEKMQICIQIQNIFILYDIKIEINL